MKYVAVSLDKFFDVSFSDLLLLPTSTELLLWQCMANVHAADPQWGVGAHGIMRSHIKVIGAVHVSAGSWMPLVQLTGYVL